MQEAPVPKGDWQLPRVPPQYIPAPQPKLFVVPQATAEQVSAPPAQSPQTAHEAEELSAMQIKFVGVAEQDWVG